MLRDLENQLRAAKDRKNALEASIKRSEGVIAENDKRVADARDKIRQLDKEIDDLQDKANALRSKFTELEIKVERLRTDIAVAEEKEDNINAEIDRNTNKINFEKKKIAQDELDDLTRMIEDLKALVPSVEEEIDRHYYYCYGEGVDVEKTGSVLVYVVKGERVGEYLHSAYGDSVKVPALRGDVHFERVDIFGAPWTNKFGYPFVDAALAGESLEFQGDFNCLSPSRSEKGYGVIKGVQSREIDVENSDGRSLKFKLGSCSRLESSSELPQVGQNFYWSAVPSSAGGYNLYTGSCV